VPAENIAIETIRIQRAARDMNTIMADPYPIRPITADEYDSFRRVHSHAFNSAPLSPARRARARRQFEPQRRSPPPMRRFLQAKAWLARRALTVYG
jgi:hypothetical protein